MYKAAHTTVLAIAVLGSIYMVNRFGDIQPQVTQVTPAIIDSRMASRGDIPHTPEDAMSRSVYVNPLVEQEKVDRNTALLKYGFTPDPTKTIESQIEEYAEGRFMANGLPSGLATLMLRSESGTGRRMISRTGCKGYYQFCPTTQKAYGLKDPFDLVESTGAAIKLAADNRRSLMIYDLPATNYHIYLSHMIGPRNFKTVKLVAEGKKVSKKFIRKASRAVSHNWHMKRLGKRSGKAQKDYPKFYKAFKVKTKNVLKSDYVYPTKCWDVRRCV